MKHAKLAFKAIKRVRGSGEAWHRNGHTIHLGHFQIDSIDTSGNVVAGCHKVAWEEIAICARSLGLEV